jgi:hypothetical protein
MAKRVRLAFPLREQPDHGYGALPFRERVEHLYEAHEVELIRRLYATAVASEGETRTRAINEMMVLFEIKEFMGDDAHIASVEEAAKLGPIPESPRPQRKPQERQDEVSEQTSFLSPLGTDSILKMPDSVRARMRGEQDNMSALSNPDANTRGVHHASPHDTEKEAAYRAMPRTGTQRRLILDAIARASERGLTDEEIAVLPGVADTAHRTRRNELVLGGWVADSGKVRHTKSDSESIVWVLTDRGREEWKPVQASA